METIFKLTIPYHTMLNKLFKKQNTGNTTTCYLAIYSKDNNEIPIHDYWSGSHNKLLQEELNKQPPEGFIIRERYDAIIGRLETLHLSSPPAIYIIKLEGITAEMAKHKENLSDYMKELYLFDYVDYNNTTQIDTSSFKSIKNCV